MRHVSPIKSNRLQRANHVVEAIVLVTELIEIDGPIDERNTERRGFALMHFGAARGTDPTADQSGQVRFAACAHRISLIPRVMHAAAISGAAYIEKMVDMGSLAPTSRPPTM